MDRTWQRAADREAPMVPLDNANAAENKVKHVTRETHADAPEVFLPRLGPDTWLMLSRIKNVS